MLNTKTLSNICFFKANVAFIICAMFIGLSCGKRKPPQPPIEKVAQRTEIAGMQRGNVILLSWNLPARNADAGSILNLSRIDVYRLAEPQNSPLSLSEEDFAARSTLISSVPVSERDFQKSELNFVDTLEFGSQNARLRYAIRFVNASGQKAAFSNFLLIEPTAKVAGSPFSLSGKVLEESIELDWKAPPENVDGSKPANIIGFNVYRFDGESSSAKILNKNPVTGNNFIDRTFNFGKDYRYFVRTVSLGSNSQPLESLNSTIIEINPRDIFPPGAPNSITIAAAPNYLSIFFAVNFEKDVVGYQIYRSNNSKLPLSEWSLLTKDLLTTNTFQDTNVESGKTYFYYLTAVDRNGNVSDKSVIISETAP